MQLHYPNSHQATPINELWEVANEPQRRLAALSIRSFSFNAVFSRDAVIFGKRRNSRSTWRIFSLRRFFLPNTHLIHSNYFQSYMNKYILLLVVVLASMCIIAARACAIYFCLLVTNYAWYLLLVVRRTMHTRVLLVLLLRGVVVVVVV